MYSLILIGLILIFAGLCMNKQEEETFVRYSEVGEDGTIMGDEKPRWYHVRHYSFIPYYMKNVISNSKRGCHADKYWDCIHKHHDMKRFGEIPEDVHNYCKKYSDDNCCFPERLSHSRTDPYYQYLDYA